MTKRWSMRDTEFWTREDDPVPPEPKAMTWEERAAFSREHPYLCPCGKCDGTGDPVGSTKVLGAFHGQPDGSLKEEKPS